MNRTHVCIAIERDPESLVVVEGGIEEGTARVVGQGGTVVTAERHDAVSNHSVVTRNQAAVILSVLDTVGAHNIIVRVLATESSEWRHTWNTCECLVCRGGARRIRAHSHEVGGGA